VCLTSTLSATASMHERVYAAYALSLSSKSPLYTSTPQPSAKQAQPSPAYFPRRMRTTTARRSHKHGMHTSMARRTSSSLYCPLFPISLSFSLPLSLWHGTPPPPCSATAPTAAPAPPQWRPPQAAPPVPGTAAPAVRCVIQLTLCYILVQYIIHIVSPSSASAAWRVAPHISWMEYRGRAGGRGLIQAHARTHSRAHVNRAAGRP
jgi:hypothetical protein